MQAQFNFDFPTLIASPSHNSPHSENRASNPIQSNPGLAPQYAGNGVAWSRVGCVCEDHIRKNLLQSGDLLPRIFGQSCSTLPHSENRAYNNNMGDRMRKTKSFCLLPSGGRAYGTGVLQVPWSSAEKSPCGCKKVINYNIY